MGKQELINTLNRASEIEKQLKPLGGSFMPDLKTIGKSLAFQEWRAELQRQLQLMKQDPLVVEILQLLNNGFRNGLTDEKDFISLRGKLNVLSSHIDDYFDTPVSTVTENMKIKKGTVVKTAFDEYTLIKQVGEGGNGRVFSAKNENGDSVAIKFVERDISPNKLKRFKNEIYFCEHHKHKNIVEILDRGYVFLDSTEYVFYVMPLYAETLRDKMKAKINPDDAIFIFTGLIEGLGYAHKLGTVHRDIKPENIMFKAGSLDPIICDFGIAHFAEEDLLTIIETKKSDRMANFQYAAPEQRVKGEVATAQTDIYAAALILNEIFTGEIAQAGDYKTIASIAPDYKFMDDVFTQLFKQKASDRLYPEEKILTEIVVRADCQKREQEKLRLQNVVDSVARPMELDAQIIKKEYLGGVLVFTLDQEMPEKWFKIICTGDLNGYTSLIGYRPEKLEIYGKNSIGMPLHGNEDRNTLKEIITNVASWIHKANHIYSVRRAQELQAEQRRKEQQRKDEIERLERENTISSLIAEL